MKMTLQVEFLNNILFKNKMNGYFVDIGANDGINGSNSLYLEKVLQWKGLCIEPITDIFEILKENRTCECINCAINDIEGIVDFLYVKSIRKPDIYIDMLSGIVNNFDDRHINRINNEILINNGSKVQYKIESKIFSNVVKNKNIDYVSIDTEGSEFNIIKSIPFNEYDIKSFSIENNYNDKNIIDFMIGNNYDYLGNQGADNIFIKRELL